MKIIKDSVKPHFKSLRTISLPGSTTFIVVNDKQRGRKSLSGKQVVIDGTTYKVKHIEYFPLVTIPKGTKIGLVV